MIQEFDREIEHSREQARENIKNTTPEVKRRLERYGIEVDLKTLERVIFTVIDTVSESDLFYLNFLATPER